MDGVCSSHVEMINQFRILIGKLKSPFFRLMHKFEDKIVMNHQ
jgi:hypothetical protein